MAVLKPTGITGTVAFLGINDAPENGLESNPLQTVVADFAGFVGESHGGLTRKSCVRVKRQYPIGTEIRNTRQISILSAEELAEIGTAMGLPAALEPSWVGANLVLAGIPHFTMIPPSSRLVFDSGLSLCVDMENQPCRFPAEVIDGKHPGLGMSFPKHAKGKRGVTGWVERPGTAALGDKCELHVPPQRLYPGL